MVGCIIIKPLLRAESMQCAVRGQQASNKLLEALTFFTKKAEGRQRRYWDSQAQADQSRKLTSFFNYNK